MPVPFQLSKLGTAREDWDLVFLQEQEYLSAALKAVGPSYFK